MIIRRNQQPAATSQLQRADGLFLDPHGSHLVEAAMEGNVFRAQQNHDTTKRRFVVVVGAAIVLVGLAVAALEVIRVRTQVKMVLVARNDPTIINSVKRPSPYYLATTKCQPFESGNFTPGYMPPWKKIGKEELQRPMKDSDLANQNGSHWTKRFGYGTAVAMSGDGKRVAVAYEGTTGFDKAFGAHIDVYEFENKLEHQYVLQQTLSDVTRFHGRDDHRVSFESVAMSSNGNRIAFSDGHGVHVYEFNEHHKLGSTTDTRHGPWTKMDPEIDLKLKSSTPVEKSYKTAGTQIAMNCDGTVIAVSGKRQNPGGIEVTYAHIFQLEIRNDIYRVGYDWADLGEVDSVKYGGSIALDASGRRLAVGSIAYAMWRGAVQTYDYSEVSNEWHPIGSMILGEKDLETFAGQVVLSADGSILAVSTKDGNHNHVATYTLVQNNVTDDLSWEKIGQDLRGSGNLHEHFGSDISLSADGKVLAVGASGDRSLFDEWVGGVSVSAENQKYFQGRIYMYRMVGGTWDRIDNGELQLKINGDMFGSSIALSSNGVWVFGGAPKREGKKSIQHVHGSAQVFRASL